MNVYIGTYSRLPSGYQEVEYIQTTGTQFINTGLLAGNNIQTETKIEVTTTSQNIPLFGCYGPSVNYRGGNYYHLTPYSSKWYFGLNGSEGNGGTYSPTVGTQYTIVFNNSAGYLNVNGSNIVSVSGTAGMSGTTLSISLRSDKEGGSTTHNFFGQYKYFYFKMYNKTTGAYERDLVPCYRKSDNVIGMYDLVNNQFYTNSGSGTFTKGADVYTNVLQNAYIGEYKRTQYTISGIPTTDTNKYINVSQSGKTIQSVKFNFITSGQGTFVHISSNNSNSYRYGVACGYNTSGTYGDSCAIRGRLGGSDSWYRQATPYNSGTSNTIEFYINRNGNCYISINGTKTSYTAGSSELNVIQTIMNLSDMNCYASQNGALLTDNKVDIEVLYS